MSRETFHVERDDGLPSFQTTGERIAWARRRLPKFKKDQTALADCVGVTRQSVSAWENNRQRPEGENLTRLAECLEVPERWLTEPPALAVRESAQPYGGHGVVRESGDVAYDPNPDPEGTPAEQLMHFLGFRVGFRRLAGEISNKDLIASAYTIAREEGFDRAEFQKLDAWRDQILEEEARGGRGGPSKGGGSG